MTSLRNHLLLAALCAFLSACQGPKAPQPDPLPTLDFPAAPDYADPSMWYTSLEDSTGTSCDVFYICSTSVLDWEDAQTGETIHYADVYNESHRAGQLNEMRGIDRRFSGSNLYIPYYRQASVEACLEDPSRMEDYCAYAASDILAAFRYYLDHLNAGRPFVLMGYSQGGYIVVELLKRLPPEAAGRLVAAYVIGYKVTEKDLRYPSIVPATGATDTGVTICYNTVETPASAIPAISGGTAIGINPVNWRTDATPATLRDSLTVVLDPESHLTCVSGFIDSYAPLPFVAVRGNYHTQEIRFYGELLSRNVLDRAAAWRLRARE